MNRSVFVKPTGKFFNLRLFWEGLKRLRVVTAALGILSIAISALFPIVYLMEHQRALGTQNVKDMNPEELCIPAALMILLAPVFIYTIFSFLQKRKDSDFFHAIPYTRTCVYVSFVTAALVSMFAVQILSGIVAGLLWSMVPIVRFHIGRFILVILVDMLAAAMLSGFMALAVTVSGTRGSTTILFFLFASLTRIVLAILAALLEGIPMLAHDYLWDGSPLSPLWFYPLSALGLWSMSDIQKEAFAYNPADVIYSLIVTLILFAVAGIIYKYRRSEMAGNPAPGKRTQILFRVLFTTPLALCFTATLIGGTDDESISFIMAVLALLCYFLYELITTKRAKNMLRAIPALLIVVFVCLGFGLAYQTTVYAFRNDTIEAEQIEWVTFDESYSFHGTAIYDYMKESVQITTPEVLSLVAEQYDVARELSTTHSYLGRGCDVTIRLESGRTVHRRIFLLDEHWYDIVKYLVKDENFMSSLFQVPLYHSNPTCFVEIQFESFRRNASLQAGWGTEQLLDIMRDELETLSMNQKAPVFSGQSSIGKPNVGDYILQVDGQEDLLGYGYRTYYLIDALPKTRAAVFSMMVSHSDEQINDALVKCDDPKMDEWYSNGADLQLFLRSMSFETEFFLNEQGVEIEKFQEVLQFLSDKPIETLTDRTMSDPDSYYLYLYGPNMNIDAVVSLSQDDLQSISKILGREILLK